MNITSLHTHILEASAAPKNDEFVWTYANRVPAFDRASNWTNHKALQGRSHAFKTRGAQAAKIILVCFYLKK